MLFSALLETFSIVSGIPLITPSAQLHCRTFQLPCMPYQLNERVFHPSKRISAPPEPFVPFQRACLLLREALHILLSNPCTVEAAAPSLPINIKETRGDRELLTM